MTTLTHQSSNESNAAIESGRYTGALADPIGVQLLFVLPVICYLYILDYTVCGSRPIAAARA